MITSHSAHLLDCSNVSVFHIQHDKASTRVATALRPAEMSAICNDLGYRPSDLMQSNCVIWAEGPSDRVYIKEWIRIKRPELVEGVHYSVMFYGGRLLSHLSASDSSVDEFISLLRLNRHVAIVCDSDRQSSGTPINQTKTRIVDEVTRANGWAWVTTGREIENYVRSERLEAEIREVHPDCKSYTKRTRYGRAVEYKSTAGDRTVVADKVKVARAVVKAGLDLSVLDADEKVGGLVDFIMAANPV